MNIGALFRYVSRELKQTIHDDKDKENAKKKPKRFNELSMVRLVYYYPRQFLSQLLQNNNMK